jgi:hypothetical protein
MGTAVSLFGDAAHDVWMVVGGANASFYAPICFRYIRSDFLPRHSHDGAGSVNIPAWYGSCL